MKYDIIIIGGGMVGLVLAHALARQTRLSIAILESQGEELQWEESRYHHRVSALSLASQQLLSRLQIWDAMKAMRVSPFKKIFVWDGLGGGQVQFNSEDIAEPTLGYIVENTVTQTALREQLKNYPQVDWHANCKLQSLITQHNHVQCMTSQGDVYEAALIVGADGAQSWVREQMHMPIDKINYEQQAIVAMVETELTHHQIASQVFQPTGPLAFLPLAKENLSSIVWSLPNDIAQEMLALDDAAFNEALSQAFQGHLGKVTVCSQRYRFPLASSHVKHYVQDRVALIGDAAHTIHPLAGQGVNMGMQDAHCLAQVIADAIHAKRDFAMQYTLRKYERQRKAENDMMLNSVHGLKALFANDKKAIQVLRSVGLDCVDKVQLLKRFFVQYAAT